MSHSKERQEGRIRRWQQRQREENQVKLNARSAEPHTQGEHSGQQRDGQDADNRPTTDQDSHPEDSRHGSEKFNVSSRGDAAEGEPYDSYYNPRQPQQSQNDPPNVRDDSNREWVSGTEDAPVREVVKGNRSSSDRRQSSSDRGPQGNKRSDGKLRKPSIRK